MITVSEIGPLLVTVPELGDVTDADAAQTACALASGGILDYIGRPVLHDTYEHTLPVRADIVTREQEPNGVVGVVRLIAHPVTSVVSVVVDGESLDADAWSWDASRYQLLIDDPAAYEAVVTYTAGFAEVPAGLRLVARRLALEALSNPGGVASERLADYSVTYGDGDFTALERRILDRYRPAVGTIRPS